MNRIDEANPSRATHSLPTDVLLSVPVVEVLLQEDRAQVIREGRVQVEAGRIVFRIADISPVLSDKTLSVTFPQPGTAKLIDARVIRSANILPEDRPDVAQQLEARIREKKHELLLQEMEHVTLKRNHRSLAKLRAKALEGMAVDASWNVSRPKDWAAELEASKAKETEVREHILDALALVEKHREALDDLNRQLVQAQSIGTDRSAQLVIDAEVSEAGEFPVRIEYVVPNACWRPCHVAELDEGSQRLTFRSEGCVWQNTGEDWNDVRLSFSTQRPSLGVEPPVLQTETLRVIPKSQGTVVEARGQKIHTTGLNSEGHRHADDIPGIDDGGEILNLKASAPATIPSDGRSHRFSIFSFSCETQTSRIFMGNGSDQVSIKTSQQNLASFPLLAGPVDLIRDCGLAGRTSIMFIAATEHFELGWGPESDLRVHVDRDEEKDKSGALSSWIQRIHHVTIRISNLGPQQREVEVTERIPVSELAKVVIEQDIKNTTDGVEADENGFIKWKLCIKPFGRETVALTYTIKKHKEVVGI